jgi:hypothetical protein
MPIARAAATYSAKRCRRDRRRPSPAPAWQSTAQLRKRDLWLIVGQCPPRVLPRTPARGCRPGAPFRVPVDIRERVACGTRAYRQHPVAGSPGHTAYTPPEGWRVRPPPTRVPGYPTISMSRAGWYLVSRIIRCCPSGLRSPKLAFANTSLIRDRLRAGPVAFLEIAAGQHRNLHGSEECRPDVQNRLSGLAPRRAPMSNPVPASISESSEARAAHAGIVWKRRVGRRKAAISGSLCPAFRASTGRHILAIEAQFDRCRFRRSHKVLLQPALGRWRSATPPRQAVRRKECRPPGPRLFPSAPKSSTRVDAERSQPEHYARQHR